MTAAASPLPAPPPSPALERRYRRLMRAYPGTYRRRHGADMLTTLMDLSVPGQSRPSLPDTLDLLRGGLRQRFRLPATARPLMLLVAVVCTVIAGGFGAVAGSWAGERTFAPMPDDAGMIALAQQAAGDPDAPARTDRSASPWWAFRANTTAEVGAGWDPAAAHESLFRDGWAVTDLQSAVVPMTVQDTEGRAVTLRHYGATFNADRDGLGMWVTASGVDGFSSTDVSMWQHSTPAFRPLLIGGTLLGMLAGWLVTAGTLRRLAGARSATRWAAGALLTAYVLVMVLPTVAFGYNLWRAAGDQTGREGPPFTVHSAFTLVDGMFPGSPSGVGTPAGLIPALTATGALIGVVTVILALRSRPATRATEQTEPTGQAA